MPPMKIEEFRSWMEKRYGGMVRFLDDGTGKSSEDGHTYFRQWIIALGGRIDCYTNITLRVGGKRKKTYLYDSRFIMRLSGGVWYLNNFESAKRYVDFFVDCALGEMLK